jgi:hypothetical protein
LTTFGGEKYVVCLKEEGSELLTNCKQLKMKAADATLNQIAEKTGIR